MDFSQQSRAWVYQANREFNADETERLQQQLNNFTQTWTAHNHQLKAGALVRYNRFIILVVDESQAGASGCSIDKSVNFLKSIEQQFNVNLFDRFNLAYRDGNHIVSVSRHRFEELITTGVINRETTVFNNLVQNLAELDTKWEVPFKDSWHIQLFSNLINV